MAQNSPAIDIDGDVRPQGAAVDIGFDECLAPPPPPPPPPPGSVCDSTVGSVVQLQANVSSLTTSTKTVDSLNKLLGSVSAAVQSSDLETARSQLANFIRTVVRYSNKKETADGFIPKAQATHLVCGAANVMTAISAP